MTDENTMLKAITDILIQAGQQIILPAYQSLIHASTKADGSVVTETDLASQRYIQSALEQLNEGIAFLGEEMTEAEQLSCLQQSDGRYWCLDPLDGTSNFTAHFPSFAISLALIENGTVQLACIHDPIRCETFTAIRGQGARMNNRPVRASAQNRIQNTVGFIDFKRLSTPLTVKLATQPIYRSQRNIGSCALEWAWLAAGRGHFIIHGGEKIWDFAAGSLIAEEAGCTVTGFTGNPLFPCDSLSSPVLATCNTDIHASLMDHLEK